MQERLLKLEFYFYIFWQKCIEINIEKKKKVMELNDHCEGNLTMHINHISYRGIRFTFSQLMNRSLFDFHSHFERNNNCMSCIAIVYELKQLHVYSTRDRLRFKMDYICCTFTVLKKGEEETQFGFILTFIFG